MNFTTPAHMKLLMGKKVMITATGSDEWTGEDSNLDPTKESYNTREGWVNGWNEDSQRYRVFLDTRLGDKKVKVIAVKEKCLKEHIWINNQPFLCHLQIPRPEGEQWTLNFVTANWPGGQRDEHGKCMVPMATSLCD